MYSYTYCDRDRDGESPPRNIYFIEEGFSFRILMESWSEFSKQYPYNKKLFHAGGIYITCEVVEMVEKITYLQIILTKIWDHVEIQFCIEKARKTFITKNPYSTTVTSVWSLNKKTNLVKCCIYSLLLVRSRELDNIEKQN